MYACHPSEKMDTLFKSHYVNTVCTLYWVYLVNHTMLNTSLIINYFNMIIEIWLETWFFNKSLKRVYIERCTTHWKTGTHVALIWSISVLLQSGCAVWTGFPKGGKNQNKKTMDKRNDPAICFKAEDLGGTVLLLIICTAFPVLSKQLFRTKRTKAEFGKSTGEKPVEVTLSRYIRDGQHFET